MLLCARPRKPYAPGVFCLKMCIGAGGWHMSFFESLERIKRKLESYSHQNFADQFRGIRWRPRHPHLHLWHDM